MKKQRLWWLGLGVAAALAVGAWTQLASVRASDHDDGEIDLKGRSLNLTDLFVFREDWQDAQGSAQNLILVMNTNPRSLARQQYYFSTKARYEFHVSRVAQNTDLPTTLDDIILRFEFGPPDADNRQAMTVTAVRDGQVLRTAETTIGDPILTTSILDSDQATLANNDIELGGETLTVFAGLREDPFFFDVEQYFRVRAGALGLGPKVSFRGPDEAVDFAAGYNVNAIVVRVPITFLQNGTSVTTYDFWETISVP